MSSRGITSQHPTTAAQRTPSGAADLWGFLAFSHGWTWLFWGIIVWQGVDVWSTPWAMALFAIGGLGLPLGGAVMTGRVAGRSGLRDLGRRLVDPRRIGGWWWAVILGLYPALKLAAGGLAVLFGAADAAFNLQEASALVVQPVDLLLYLGFVLLLGPLPEEIGWRGYLLDRLQLRYSALGASVLVGLAWFAWHGPLFAMAGYYARAGGAPDPLQFGVAILLGAVLYTWIYNNTGRSVLAAILFHFSGNVSGELLDTSASVYAYETYLTAALVLVVLWRWGAEALRRAEADSSHSH
ncbi:MAG: CPBP family intramembrane metalloprotease [Bacteroidetes bacterium]|jgi:membrane protease YdiL (CAAX protease family)|nr:CPBP family intramembrane metalloprotease [Bacteroidota bacterium]